MEILVHIDQWHTAGDEFVCGVCQSLDKALFVQGVGPYPIRDTHPKCRCRRSFHHSILIEFPRSEDLDDESEDKDR